MNHHRHCFIKHFIRNAVGLAAIAYFVFVFPDGVIVVAVPAEPVADRKPELDKVKAIFTPNSLAAN